MFFSWGATHTHIRKAARRSIHSIQIPSPFSACMDFFFAGASTPCAIWSRECIVVGIFFPPRAARLENCICCFLRYHLSPPKAQKPNYCYELRLIASPFYIHDAEHTLENLFQNKKCRRLARPKMIRNKNNHPLRVLCFALGTFIDCCFLICLCADGWNSRRPQRPLIWSVVALFVSEFGYMRTIKTWMGGAIGSTCFGVGFQSQRRLLTPISNKNVLEVSQICANFDSGLQIYVKKYRVFMAQTKCLLRFAIPHFLVFKSLLILVQSVPL
jgi:hypothetical protein